MEPSQTWVGITAILAFAACVIFYLTLHFREKREKLSAIRQAIELSNASSPEDLSAWAHAVSDPQSDLWRALSDVGLGLGLLAAGGVLQFAGVEIDTAVWPMALGVIVLFQGGGRLLAYALTRDRADK